MPDLKIMSEDTSRKKLITGLRSASASSYAEICARVKPDSDHSALREAMEGHMPGADFQLRHVRSGWHRQGGIVSRDLKRVSDNIRRWAEEHFDEDGILLGDDEAPEDYLATRFDGETLYFIAVTGPDAEDFIQVEVECLQEVTDHELVAEGFDPYDIEDFIDPPHRVRVDPELVGEPFYKFRQVTDVADLMQDLSDVNTHNKRFVRFMTDWSRSSAAGHTQLSDHWVFRLFHFTDRFGESRTEATPLSTKPGELPLTVDNVPHGADLANLLHEFDHNQGYPMAWYFELLAHGKDKSPAIISAVHQDLSSWLDYLPEKDAKIVREWVRAPYCF